MTKGRVGLLSTSGPRLSRQAFLRGGAAGLATAGMASLLGALGDGSRTAALAQAPNPRIITKVTVAANLGPDNRRRVHVGAVTSDGGLFHTQRVMDGWLNVLGPWTPLDDVKAAARSDPGPVVDVDFATDSYSNVHAIVATSDGGVWHTINYRNGSWQQIFSVKYATRTDPGRVVAVTASAVPEVLLAADVAFGAVTSDGGLFHAVRRPNGDWTPLGNVKAEAGNPGDIIDADFAAPGYELHAVALTRDNGIWHTIRYGNGTWQQFGGVSPPGRGLSRLGSIGNVAAAGHLFQLHVGAVVSGGLLHTIRYASGAWEAGCTSGGPCWDIVSSAAGPANIVQTDFAFDDLGFLHAAVLTSNGGLWYAFRYPSNTPPPDIRRHPMAHTWTQFEKVV